MTETTDHLVDVDGVQVDTRHWIGGERVASASTFTDISPIDEQPIAEVAAGTSADFTFRPIAERVSQKLGQPVVLNYRPGASGTIAADSVAKAAPDGYTILYVNSVHTANPSLLSRLPYDTLRDFAGVAMVAESPTKIGRAHV